MVSLVLKKTFNSQNICRGFKIGGIWPLHPTTMVRKMQSSKWFMEPKVSFQMIDLQVEEVLGECNFIIKPNVCHYYVEMQA